MKNSTQKNAPSKKENTKAESSKGESRLKFDKDLFKRSVVYNIKTTYRKDLEVFYK